jgi:hypothetical protein
LKNAGSPEMGSERKYVTSQERTEEKRRKSDF